MSNQQPRIVKLAGTIDIPPISPNPELALARAGMEVSHEFLTQLENPTTLKLLDELQQLVNFIEPHLLRNRIMYLLTVLELEEKENVGSDN